MAATQVTFDNKSNFIVQANIPTDQKARAEDLNEIKNAINTNAALTDTNTANVATNTAAITPGTSNSTAIDLTNRVGTMHTNSGAAMADTAFTLAASPVEFGCGIILSNAATIPAIAGATKHSNFDTDYQTGSDNLILVSYLNGVARYQVVFN